MPLKKGLKSRNRSAEVITDDIYLPLPCMQQLEIKGLTARVRATEETSTPAQNQVFSEDNIPGNLVDNEDPGPSGQPRQTTPVNAHQKQDNWKAIARKVQTLEVYKWCRVHCRKRWGTYNAG
ncbi:uncharacterized protein LOC144753235 [Lissotriton helveticus]